jgi:hypothetical protein
MGKVVNNIKGFLMVAAEVHKTVALVIVWIAKALRDLNQTHMQNLLNIDFKERNGYEGSIEKLTKSKRTIMLIIALKSAK